jgi:HEAT repeat protein
VSRARTWACLTLLLAPFAAAAAVDEQEAKASIRVLETGEWDARMRTVHELEYLQDDALRPLTIAAEDGDWQVRMAAVNELGPLGPKAELVLKRLLRHEPCPVVRLIALHELGSQLPSADEEKALGWMFSAKTAEVNDCHDQAAPGRAPWAATARNASSPRSERTQRRAAPAPAPEPAESEEEVVTPDVPARAPVVSAPPAPKPVASAPPTKDQRLAELDSLLAGITPPQAPRRKQAPETLPTMPPAPQAEERPAATGPGFEAAGGKAPHDALPDLLLQLSATDARARARAADDLGSRGGAAASAVPALMSALADRSPRVRASASLALGNIGAEDHKVVPLLVHALKDKSQDVRYAAALALSRIRTPAADAAFRTSVDEGARHAIETPRP